jgi:HSP20 family protein
MAPAVDIAEKDKAYEITAELPGLDQNNIELKLANGTLMIKGEKKQETEKKKNSYMSERRYGAFRALVPGASGCRPKQRSRRPSQKVS